MPPHTGVRAVATGVYRYIYHQNQSLKIICVLIAADDVRLLVYRTVVLCSKNFISSKTNFWLRPWQDGERGYSVRP